VEEYILGWYNPNMAKPSKKEIEKRIKESFKYRWEFLRRNKNYQKDYDRWEQYERPTWETPKSPYPEIFKKYLFPPLDYKLSYKELLKERDKQIKKHSTGNGLTTKEEERCWAYEWCSSDISGDSMVVQMCYDDLKAPFGIGDDLEERLDVQKYSDDETIKISINLEYPKEIILNEVEYWIDFYNYIRKEYDKIPQKRKRLKEYQKYLDVYDLKTKKKNYDQIVQTVFKKDYEKATGMGEELDLDSVITKAKRYYREAKRLVNGGYKEIR